MNDFGAGVGSGVSAAIAPAHASNSASKLYLPRDRQTERTQDERRHRLPRSRHSCSVRRIRSDISQLERVGLQIVELMRLVLAYPANVFVVTKTHGTVVDV